MKYVTLALSSFVALSACLEDETLTAYGAADRLWSLVSLDEQTFSATASIRFDTSGAVTGMAPCNNFTATQTAPYPWFVLTPISSTRRACSDLGLERDFLSALADMSLAEVSGNTLVLSNDAGRVLVFTTAE